MLAAAGAFAKGHQMQLQLIGGATPVFDLAWVKQIVLDVVTALDPPVLEISLLNTAELQLQWEAIPGAQDYEVYQQATLGGESSLLLTTSETSGALPVVVDDSSLYFVRAIN